MKLRHPRLHLPCWLAAGIAVALAIAARAELTKAIQIRSLSHAEAKSGLPVKLRGTVTFIEGPRAVFVQDETAGTFFRPDRPDKLRPGDVLEVTGNTHSGVYLPGIGLASYQILGHGPLPAAVAATYDDLLSGRFHYQRVAIEGIARSLVPFDEGRSLLRVDLGFRIVDVRVDAVLEEESGILDSRVRVLGLAAGGINNRRQLVQPYLRSRDATEIIVLEPAVAERDVPRVAASDLLTFRVTGQGSHRVRIDGVVTACPSRMLVFVRSGQTAFGVRFFAPTTVEIGDRIEVLGFTEMGRFSASIVDAKLVVREPGAAPAPREVDFPEVLNGTHDGDLISVQGVLTDSFRTDGGSVLVLQKNGRALQARGPARTTELPIGAVLRVVGICQVESSTSVVLNSRPQAVGLELRSSDDITILHAPSWWTVRRLAMILAVLAAVVLLAGLWIWILRRQVSQKTAALRQRIESEAALHERQRIARDFHDTLEQELAGLSLRLDAVATRNLDEKSRGLVGASRNLVSRVQAETRNLISDLRNSAERAGDLVSALRELTQRYAEEPGVVVTLQSSDGVPKLPAAVVHHLRMIAGECVTNARKHAGATTIVIGLAVNADRLLLTVTDNGCGFDAAAETTGRNGRFGCVGIRERCRKFGAEVTWTSETGAGTTVLIGLDGGLCKAGESEMSRTAS